MSTESDTTPARRLARITVDVLLPVSFRDIDLDGLEVAGVLLVDEDKPLRDILDDSIVEARLVPVAS